MSEETQTYLGLESSSIQTNPGFQSTLDYIRERATSEYRKGELFERLMLTYLSEDPDYKEQFSEVYLYKQWAAQRTDFDANDIGIDLVAKERHGGYCAIQCKCYAEDTRISKPALDSFISASASELFTSRLIIDTGGEWGPNALRTIDPIRDKLRIIRYSDLESSPFDWPDLSLQDPEQLAYKQRRFHLKDHQKEAFDDVINGFKEADRGKMIMACGTGKTFTALRIAEGIAGTEGRVLYLVPSIGLLSQAMREWSEQRGIDHSYVGICSDTHAGSTSEDASIQELKIPVTTDPSSISHTLQNPDSNKMTAVFCTYQSLPLIEKAQDEGAPPFDVIFCDEAHRTTGVEAPGDKTSPFVLVHDADRIRANKRLYMTATPRLYTEGAKAKAARHDIEVFSMDDPETYGEEFHRLPFSKAVEQDLLSDYKVVVLAMSEQSADAVLQTYRTSGGSEININDATKIVGCWRALQNPERKSYDDPEIRPLTRAIAFTNTIAASKSLVNHWDGVIESAIERMPEDQHPSDFKCETEHVDGKTNALNRKKRIEWLKGNSNGVCRILSNARCLSEGIDVPALDAVLFMSPRNSHVDIVQAVGRVMRKAPGKTYGYIVLPVAIPADADPADILNDNARFASVWNVLRALRSHDDRLNAEINRIDLNTSTPDRIIFTGLDSDGISENGSLTWNGQQLFLPMDLPPEAIFAKIVEKCGDRKYWESWAKDVADIFRRVVGRIEGLLDNRENNLLREWFDDFHTELKSSINDAITRSNAIDMMAQHILTRPVFEALFENYDFASGNPVAVALDKLQEDFGEFGLEDETRDLGRFYESVRIRARGIDNTEGRQRVLLELYEKFFATALKKDAERLGIVYTPVEVVDFILHSANEVLQTEFGRTLSDDGIHILDPFTGAGIFLARLIQSGLIRSEDLERKYHNELHANEIVLLAYYIAAVNIEEAFHGQRGEKSVYEPFDGIVLTDTFNLNTGRTPSQKTWLPDNDERAKNQQRFPIQVIVGNPPWSAGQQSATDDNPNVEYLALEKRIEETYAERSTVTNKRHLYDTYKMAIRWASDRIDEQGVIAFVTNGSWIDGNADAGIRACLAEEFNSAYVLNLRGDARTSGERRRSEGGNVFGIGSRSPVAITILVKNPNATHDGCKIQYRDIGNYLTREEKLDSLSEAVSIEGFSNWQTITPNKHHDWIDQRSDAFAQFYPLGSENAKAGRTDDAMLGLYSLGLVTSRDAYIYNFSRDTCAENALLMTQDYLAAFSELEQNPELTVEEASRRYAKNLKWAGNLKDNLKQRKTTEFKTDYIRKVVYRPFIATNCYANYVFIHRKHQMDRIFPDVFSENRVICVPGTGSKKAFSTLMINRIPDYQLIFNGQCFPRWQYPRPADVSNTTRTFQDFDDPPDRIDNISDTALQAFREHYRNDTISKDDIFDYIYGLLHAPSYSEQFANDLSKMIPRIPFAPDFRDFSEAGQALADFHLNYETCQQYSLELVFAHYGEPQPEHFQLGKRAMRFADNEKTTLIINEHTKLSGIPEAAHWYVVNGRTPLEWFINRYKITQDKDSGIINDPNDWFENPRDLITAIERIVHVSVESTKIIESLPSEITSD